MQRQDRRTRGDAQPTTNPRSRRFGADCDLRGGDANAYLPHQVFGRQQLCLDARHRRDLRRQPGLTEGHRFAGDQIEPVVSYRLLAATQPQPFGNTGRRQRQLIAQQSRAGGIRLREQRAKQAVQAAQIVLHGRRGDECALALLTDQELLAHQFIHRLTQCDTADRKALGQDRFGIQPLARLEPAGADRSLQIVGKLPV